jgi:hypothetical protein
MKNKLLWLLAGVIAFDFGITMLGQPASYWHHPETAHEGNPVARWFMVQGIVCYLAYILGYIAGVVTLVSRLPRRAAIITGLVFLLIHYFAGSGWLAFHFHHDMIGPAIYALVISIALILILDSADWKACFGNDNRERK